MITCRTLVEVLADYLGEELPDDQCDLVREHLAACSQCAAFADSYRKTINVVRQLPPLPLPPETLQRLREAWERGDLKSPKESPKP